MAQRTVDPTKIKTLSDWVANWPKASNLGFDPETREATVYDRTKERAKVAAIPWKREVDVLTVLTQPASFSAKAVAISAARIDKLREQKSQMRQAAEGQLRLAEATLLEAWRNYASASAAQRGLLRHEILVAESAVREIELGLADKGRMLVGTAKGISVQVPPIALKRRGLTIEDTV
jgi:hypothetical protein